MKVAEELGKIKTEVRSLADNLLKKGILNEQDYKTIIDKLSQEKILLGVAGQMKYGKSTFINALIFKDSVLPTADTPMTAILTKIEYGDKEEYEVEFFSKEDWKIIEELAQNSPDEDEKQANKERIQMAKERLGGEIYNLLGKKRTVSKRDLENYVGAEGKFTPIVKGMTVRYPHEILKQVTIVDTPGFNDPVVSREKEAERFLKDADCLIFMLYAGRAFDATDRFLIVNRIAQFGSGGVILALNKYDELLEEAGSLDEVLNYVEQARESMIKEIESDAMREVIRNAPLIPISSLMALLGYMPLQKIERDEELSWYYEDFKEKFPFLQSQEDFVKYSGIEKVEEEIKNLALSSKVNVIKQKVSSLLVGRVNEKLQELQKAKLLLESERENLSKSLQEIEKEIEEIVKFREYELSSLLDIDRAIREVENILRDYEERTIREIESKFNSIFFGEIGLVDFGGYKKEVMEKVKSALFDAEGILLKETRNAIEDVKDKLKDFVKSKGQDLILHPIIQKYSKFTGRTIYELLEIIEEYLEVDIDSLKINIQLKEPDIGEKFLILGESKETAKQKAESYKKKVKYEVIREVMRYFKYYRDAIGKEFIKQHFIEPIDKYILHPIEESLESAKKNIRNKDKRLKEIEKALKEIEQTIKEVSETKNYVENKLKALGR